MPPPQVSHALPQPESQHTPSTQWPLVHWLASEQVSPSPRRGRHAPVDAQYWAAVQFASLAHESGQPALVPLHRYGAQLGLPGPVVAMQVPTEPLTLHALQAPVHAKLQHTPSTQRPEAHWLSLAHDVPFARRGRHRPDWQENPSAHTASLAHDAGHEVLLPLQTKAAHEGEPAEPAGLGVQVPLSQLSHAPAQLELQHTPLTQFPEVHCEALAHAAPLPPLLTHAPAVQL